MNPPRTDRGHVWHPIMVKIGPSLQPSHVERLAQFAHEASQDGTQGSCTLLLLMAYHGPREKTELMDATDPLVTALPSPSADPGQRGSGSQVGEPTLSKVMATIKSCHASLSTQSETIRVDFALPKDDVHKIRHR